MSRAALLVLVAGAFLGVPLARTAVAAPQTTRAPFVQDAAAPPDARGLLNRYCVSCHNLRTRVAGLALDSLDVARIGGQPEVWEKVVRKLRAGLMPPAGLPRPARQDADGLAAWLERDLDRAAESAPNPGRTEALHRLNRFEYRNAIRDLLALDIDVSAMLPVDEASYGFDNMAGVQRMSPTLMERYLTAAEKVAAVAVADEAMPAGVDTFQLADDLAQDDRIDGLPFGTRGGAEISYHFPLDGEYVIRVQIARYGVNGTNDDIFPFDRPQHLEMAIDGAPVRVFTLAAVDPRDRSVFSAAANRRDLDADWQVRLPVKAGPHAVRVTFLNRTPAVLETLVRPLRAYAGDGRVSLRSGAYLRKVQILGPFAAAGAEGTPSRHRIFTCQPAGAPDETRCATAILSTLARRAYRRPVTKADLSELLMFFERGRADGGFEGGVAAALRGLLVMPAFLFRTERDPAGITPHTAYQISDLELASRLSFFLWSSLPDDELVDLAVRGQLRRPAVLEQQLRRMIADPRSRALVSSFAGQWLFLRNVPSVRPDPWKDPDFDEGLRQAFQQETEMFFDSIVREDRSALDLLTADYTFVNERLARHYGMPGVSGSHFRRVAVASPDRRGLLGQGSILSVTSYPHRTSPVIRGKWILENLFGTPPPPPPPNVPDLKDNESTGQALSLRDRMAQHRANPVCASCHQMMDPLGFALENFDLAGRWRARDEYGLVVDASGTLPDGTKFDGPEGLRNALLGRREQFVTTVIEKLLGYAVGRGIEYYDAPTVRAIARAAAEGGYRFTSGLILGVVRSPAFQMRRPAS